MKNPNTILPDTINTNWRKMDLVHSFMSLDAKNDKKNDPRSTPNHPGDTHKK